MSAQRVFKVVWHEDGSATALGRATARNGSGGATGMRGEGSWLKQADVSTITCAVYDKSSSTPETAIATPTVTVSTSVIDSPVTSNEIWTEDTTGYNFLHDLAASNFPTGDHVYRVSYTWTLSGGESFHASYEGRALPKFGG